MKKKINIKQIFAIFTIVIGMFLSMNSLFSADAPPCASDPCIPANAVWTELTHTYNEPSCPNCVVTITYLRLRVDACQTTFFYIESMSATGACFTSPCTIDQNYLFNAALDDFYADPITDELEYMGNVVKLELASCWKYVWEDGYVSYYPCGTDCCQYVFDPDEPGYIVYLASSVLCPEYISPIPGDCWAACGWIPPVGPATPKKALNIDLGNIEINPNPATDKVLITIPTTENGVIEIKIYDLNGNLMLHKVQINNSTNVDINTWANGTYLVKIFVDNQQISKTYKFVISK